MSTYFGAQNRHIVSI